MIAVKKKSKKNHQVDAQKTYDEIMFNEAGSSNECTGLIPSGPFTDDQYDSYRDIQNFDAKGQDKL